MPLTVENLLELVISPDISIYESSSGLSKSTFLHWIEPTNPVSLPNSNRCFSRDDGKLFTYGCISIFDRKYVEMGGGGETKYVYMGESAAPAMRKELFRCSGFLLSQSSLLSLFSLAFTADEATRRESTRSTALCQSCFHASSRRGFCSRMHCRFWSLRI